MSTNANNVWFTTNKMVLIDSRLLSDEPMTLPDGKVSEVTYDGEAAKRILSMDESHHPFTTEVDRDGSRSKTYGNDK